MKCCPKVHIKQLRNNFHYIFCCEIGLGGREGSQMKRGGPGKGGGSGPPDPPLWTHLCLCITYFFLHRVHFYVIFLICFAIITSCSTIPQIYVDDYFLILNAKPECNNFFEHLNQQFPSLSFNMETKLEHTLPSLDIKIRMDHYLLLCIVNPPSQDYTL